MRRLLTIFTVLVLTTLCADLGLAQNGSEHPIITPENAPQVVQLERLGNGQLGSDDQWPPIVGRKIAWSPDGTWLAVAGSLGARLYRADALDTPVHFLDHDGWVSDVVFSLDSSTLMTVSQYSTYSWDVQTGAQIPAAPPWGNTATFSPDGKLLALGGNGCGMGNVCAEVRLIDTTTGTELAVMDSEWSSRVADITFSPDGSLLAATWTTVSFDGCDDDDWQGLQVWRVDHVLAKGVVKQGEELYEDVASVLAFSPDGKRLASGNARFGGGLVFRDAQTGEVQTVVVENGAIHDMAFSPDGSLFVAAVLVESGIEKEYALRVFDAETGAELDTLSTEPVYSLAFNPDGSALAAVGRDRVTIWRPEESGWVQSGGIASLEKIELSPDAIQLVLYSETTLAIQNIETGARQEFAEYEGTPVKDVLFSLDGSSLLSIAESGAAQVWDIQTGALRLTLNQRFSDSVGFAISPDGRLIASYDMSYQDNPPPIQLWDALTGRKNAEFELPSKSARVEFSPDGKLLAVTVYAAAFSGLPIYLWDVRNAYIADEFATYFPSHPFTLDATRVVYETYLGDIGVRDISTQSDIPLHEVGVNDFLTTAVFNPDGTRLAIAIETWLGCGPGEANTLHVWDVSGPPDSYFEIASVEITHVNDLAYNPESTVLAAATEYGIVLVDARDGTSLTRLGADQSPFYQVRFAPDGRTLLSKGGDGAVRVWGVPVLE